MPRALSCLWSCWKDDTSYDNIILGAVNHDDTLEQLKGTGLKIVNL